MEISLPPTLIWKLSHRVTRASLEVGLFPRKCPLCLESLLVPSDSRNPIHIHHWGPSVAGLAIREGKYRRICSSCNIGISLGISRKLLYSDRLTWNQQLACLPITGGEKSWSLLLPQELAVLRKLVDLDRSTLWEMAQDKSSYTLLVPLLDSSKSF